MSKGGDQIVKQETDFLQCRIGCVDRGRAGALRRRRCLFLGFILSELSQELTSNGDADRNQEVNHNLPHRSGRGSDKTECWGSLFLAGAIACVLMPVASRT